MTSDRYRALIVDDEFAIQKMVARELARQGFECEFAFDGQQAIELTDQSHFDVVITDLKMPNMHGHALALELLHREDRPCVVILTGVMEPALAKDLLQHGVDDILFKPIDFSYVAAKVKMLLDRPARNGAGKGSLSEEAAHDFNNLLTIITSYSNMLLESLEENDPLRKPLTEIKTAGERSAALTRQLMASSK